MHDVEIINKIQKLKNIEPDSNWVYFVRENLLNGIHENEEIPVSKKLNIFEVFSFPALKPVALTLVSLIFVSAFSGAFLMTKKAAPGESFYSVKLTYQKLKTNFISPEQKPQTHLDYAYGRIEDMERVKEEKMDAGVNEATKQIASDISNATNSLKEIKDPSKKLAARISLVKQVSKLENTLIKEKDNLSQISQDKISEVEKLAQEAKTEVLANLMSDSEDNSDYRKMVEDLQKEIAEYESETRGIDGAK